MIEFNSGSNQHISILLFGGKLKVKDKEYAGIIKSGVNKGNIKYRVVEQEVEIKGLGLKPQAEWETKKAGIYQTSEDIIGVIAKANKGDASEVCKILLKIRELNKQISTYYNSTEEVIQPNDSCVHQQLIQVRSDTGRLSATAINSQNQPKPPSKVTQHFVSRYLTLTEVGPFRGKIVIADYKSLEPRVEAELSGDKNLRRDVINNVDPHSKNLALAEHKEYEEVVELVNSDKDWSSKRSKIKGFTFSQQYLASVRTTAKNSGLSEYEVTNILEARMQEYPQLYKWHENNQKQVNSNGFYKNPLGRMFYFKKYPIKYSWQKEESYSKNDIANYITQGTGWDICGIMIGIFWREKALHNRDKYVMINTIHDNLMCDCRDEYVGQLKDDMKILENWKEVCKQKFNYDWSVDIKVDISEGNSWYDCF